MPFKEELHCRQVEISNDKLQSKPAWQQWMGGIIVGRYNKMRAGGYEV